MNQPGQMNRGTNILGRIRGLRYGERIHLWNPGCVAVVARIVGDISEKDLKRVLPGAFILCSVPGHSSMAMRVIRLGRDV